MLRPFQICFIVTLIAVFYIASPPMMAAEDEQATLELIQAKAVAWRNSIVNVRVVYELRSLPSLKKALVDWDPPKDSESSPRFAEDEWIWADHGLDLLDTRAFYWTPGKPGVRTLDVFNGPEKLVFRANYHKSPEEVETLQELTLGGVADGKPTSTTKRPAMTGLYWPGSADWLPDVLIKSKWKLEGFESVSGDRCAKLSTQTSTLWIDLKHDCLPRRRLIIPDSIRRIGEDFIVDELQQLEGGLWFPKRARLQLQSDPPENQLIVVTEAAINQSLDLTRFSPP